MTLIFQKCLSSVIDTQDDGCVQDDGSIQQSPGGPCLQAAPADECGQVVPPPLRYVGGSSSHKRKHFHGVLISRRFFI